MKSTSRSRWTPGWSQAASKKGIKYISAETNYSPSKDFCPNPRSRAELQSGAVEGQEVVAAVALLDGEVHEERRAADSAVGAVGEAGLEPLAVAQEGLVVETEADAGGVDSAAEAGAGVEDAAGDHTKRLRENDAGFAPCPNVFCVYSGGCNIFCANDPCILGWEPRRKMAVNDRQIVN